MRFCISVVLFVLLEISLKRSRILGCRLPHLALAYFKQQQAVVVLLEKITEFGIVKLVRPEFANALLPMFVTEFGIRILVKPEHP